MKTLFLDSVGRLVIQTEALKSSPLPVNVHTMLVQVVNASESTLSGLDFFSIKSSRYVFK